MRIALSFLATALAAALVAPLLAGDAETEVAPDVAVRVEKTLFYPPVRLRSADGVIDTGPAHGHSGPRVVDVDGDGVKDLVVGDYSGFFHFYRNDGTDREPRYAKPVNLQAGGVEAKVPIY